MPIGFARIVRVGALSAPNNYGYTWKDSDTQEDVDSFVSGKSLSLAFTEVGTLFQALAGTVIWGRIATKTDTSVQVGELWRTTVNGPYAYRFKANGADYATTVVSRTLAQAYNGIGALVTGTVLFSEIEGEST
jgi:hypothetical protein